MIRSFQVGDIKVTSLVEYFGPTHDPAATYPDYSAELLAKSAEKLPPGHFYPAIGKMVIAIQIWIVFTGNRVILIDTGVGNGKTRPAARMNLLNTLVPQWLAAAGVTRENVTDVVMTHLHSDHIGWNTVFEDGRWAPTFFNARHHVPKRDFDYFNGLHEAGTSSDTSFADSLLPVLDAGLVDFVDATGRVADILEARPAFGHTPGQLNYWIQSRGQHGVFSADIFHHPLQILNPGWNTAFCILPDEARSTRAAFLARAAETGALVMPCHFPPPHCGYIQRDGDDYRYVPAS